MTVCIAARSGGLLVAASDRMLTSGDVQFEPPAQKIVMLTSSIAVMSSGDASFHAEILTDVYRSVATRIEARPNEWIEIRQAVDWYVNFRNAAKRKRAEAQILAPLGLTSETFLDRQRSMDSAIVEVIARDLIQFDIPELSTIILGIDTMNGVLPHIYTVEGDSIRCDDTVGFSAVGSGARHAETALMLAGHAWHSPLADTLLRTYSAKRNAEIAPGVGLETDMWVIGPGLGQSVPVGTDAMANLRAAYEAVRSAQNEAQTRANATIAGYLEELGGQTSAPQDQPPKPEPPDAASEGPEREKPH